MSEFVYLFRSTPAAQEAAIGTPERAQKSMQTWLSWIRDLESKGHLKHPGQPLDRGGKVVSGKSRLVTDGPFVEAKDMVLGFIVIEARDLAEALEVAKGCPILEDGSVEIPSRPATCAVKERRQTMRRIVMFNRVSADGSFADGGGGFNFGVPDDELDAEATHGMDDVDTMLFGRKTYDAFESFWPHALDEDPHAPGRTSENIRAMATWINQKKKIVFSRTKGKVSWQNSQLIEEFDPQLVQELKQGPGKNIIIFGSGQIVSLLTQNRLIDEYAFVVNPVLLGSSRPPITGLNKLLKLDLLDVKQYRSGNVKLRYQLAQK